MADVEHVKPQDYSLRNSPKSKLSTGEMRSAFAQGAACYWNDKKYSDGGQVCDAHRRFECWDGKWADIGDC